jgi:hypothetical protein
MSHYRCQIVDENDTVKADASIEADAVVGTEPDRGAAEGTDGAALGVAGLGEAPTIKA